MFTIFHASSYCIRAIGQRYQHVMPLSSNVYALLDQFEEHRQDTWMFDTWAYVCITESARTHANQFISFEFLVKSIFNVIER